MCAIDRPADLTAHLQRSVDLPDYFYEDCFDDEANHADLMGPMPETTAKSRRQAPAGLPAYMATLWSRPLLNQAQEQHCFRKLNLLKHLASRAADAVGEGCDGDGLEELYGRLAAIDKQRNEIAEANLRLVVSIAKRRSAGSPQDFDEMVGVGNAALLRAVDLFDFRRGFRFSTYAYRAIERSIFGLHRLENRYQQSKVAQADQVLSQQEGDAGDADRSIMRMKEAANEVRCMLEALDRRDQHIIRARFGINREDNGVAFHVIASEIGLSTTRTVQLFHRSMKRMRELAKDADECESTQAA